MKESRRRPNRPVRVRGDLRSRPDVRAIARVVIALAMAESQREAEGSKDEGRSAGRRGAA